MKKLYSSMLVVGLLLGSNLALANGSLAITITNNANSLKTQDFSLQTEGIKNGWQLYENKAAGFSLKFPKSILLMEPSEIDANTPLALSIVTEKIESIGYTPLNYDEETSKKDEEALKEGNYGEHVDYNPVEASKKVRALSDHLNAKEFMVLSRFEVCDVTFERKLIFYHNGYRTILTLHGPVNAIRLNNPEYFMVENYGCGNDLIWNYHEDNVRGQFYQNVKDHKLSDEAEEWFGGFDEIVDTIEIK